MDNKIWAETLLVAYTRFDSVIFNLDKVFESKISGMYGRTGSCEKQFDNLLKLVIRKKNIQYAKSIVDSVFRNIDKDIEILKLKHLKYQPYSVIGENYGISIRTVFRKYDMQLESFAKKLARMGFDFIKCNEIWGDDNFLIKIYGKLVEKNLVYKKPKKAVSTVFIGKYIEEKSKNQNDRLNHNYIFK